MIKRKQLISFFIKSSRLFPMIGIIAALSGCNANTKTVHYLENLQIIANDDANNRSPVALDLVYVTNPKLAEKLSLFTAAEYFQNRKQLLRDYPQQMLSLSWEVVPGQTLQEKLPDTHPGVVAVFLFADYFTPGAHRATLAPGGTFYIHLTRDDMRLSNGETEIPLDSNAPPAGLIMPSS
jgi:type VI secretion system protein